MTRRSLPIVVATAIAAIAHHGSAAAAALEWKGRTWEVTDGGMAGVCEGSPSNVSVDADGYLHLQIAENGGTWTAAEVFSTEELGFGTYQWQLDGPIDTYDRQIVVGLFPYGPAAGIGEDGTNEIDIEFARWGQENGPNGDFTNYPASGTTIGEHTYTFSLEGSTLSTARFVWSSTSIESSLLAGIQAVGSTSALIETFTYAPSNPTTNVPQRALPLGMNFWCFESPPSDGNPVELVIRDFTFVPEGAAGAGGAGGSGGAGAGAGSGGAAAGSAGKGGSGGSSGNGGSAGTGGRGGASGGASAGSSGGTTAGSGGTTAGSGGTTAGSGGTSSTTASNGACSCTLPGGAARREPAWPALFLALLLRRRRRRGIGGRAPEPSSNREVK